MPGIGLPGSILTVPETAGRVVWENALDVAKRRRMRAESLLTMEVI
jgi:hypothetical protein